MIQRKNLAPVLLGILVILILAAPVAAAGLTIANGAKIITTTGSTSPVITVTGSPIAKDGNITIDITALNLNVVNNPLDQTNLIITDNATTATWTGLISGNFLNLTSTGGPTAVGNTINLTFTGDGGNPWIAGTGSEWTFTLTAIRSDKHGSGDFDFVIETPSGILSVADGAKITTATGATSPVITITGSPIGKDGTITIDISSLHGLVASGTLTSANLVIADTAAAATWTGSISGNTLTLTSTGGPTAAGETVNVTFTGAGGNPWVAGTHGVKTVSLAAKRTDTSQTDSFDFIIETAPPSGYSAAADFSAPQTSDIAPLPVTFTDASTGNPSMWNWSFGDNTWFNTTDVLLKSPVHTYANAGMYTVNLTVTNAYGSDTKSQPDYITVLNGIILTANTTISGLTITNCGGPQTITVDTSILKAALIPNNSVLEIQPPANRGLKNITIYALDGAGFSRSGSIITGNPTSVHLVSEDIAPSPGFSPEIGRYSAFNYSTDLPSYPCNAVIRTKIWEGGNTEYDTKLQQIAAGNGALVVGTAYTASISTTNIPSNVPVNIHMSINTSWDTLLPNGPGHSFIWWISNDGKLGQVLPTNFLYTDPVKGLDYNEADSPRGLGTFGLSSLSGNNNPLQLITLVIVNQYNPPSEINSGSGSNTVSGAGKGTAPQAIQNPNKPELKSPPEPPDPGKTQKIYANANGVITQKTDLTANNKLATLMIGEGVTALEANGQPLSSVSIAAVPEDSLPAMPQGSEFAFAGRAYDLKPDGARFSPEISIVFTAPVARFGDEFAVKTYDETAGAWQDVPTSYNPKEGTITARISHFCNFAVFTKTPVSENSKSANPAPTQMAGSSPAAPKNTGTAIDNFVHMVMWLINLIKEYPIIVLAIIILIGAIFLYKKRQRRYPVMSLY
jgi:PKD repeat protein